MSQYPNQSIPPKQDKHLPKPVLVAVLLVIIVPTVVLAAVVISNILYLRYPITQGVTVYQSAAPTDVPYPTGAVDLPTNGTMLISGVTYKASILLNATESFATPLDIKVQISHKRSGPTLCAIDYSKIWGLSYDKIWLQAYNGTFLNVPLTYNATTQSWEGAIHISHLIKGTTKIPILVTFYPNVAQGVFEMNWWIIPNPIGAPGLW